jgi:hypothetical protein
LSGLSSALAIVVPLRLPEVPDDLCIEFIYSFYEKLFGGSPISRSFEDAKSHLLAKGIATTPLRLDRKHLIQHGNCCFIESRFDNKTDTILINLDAVLHKIHSFMIPQEELCHLISRKIGIHARIFKVPRERCILPIGRLLFGEFSWEDAGDVV